MADGKPTVLIVDDDAALRTVLRAMLKQEGFHPVSATNGREALRVLESRAVDAVVTDVRMPLMDGMQLLDEARSLAPSLPIVVLTGHGDVPLAVEAVKRGATDFVLKPPDRSALVATLRRECEKEDATPELLGESPAFLDCLRTADRVAGSEVPVLILGETGTGKELLARRIHDKSARARSRLVSVNVAAIPEALLESTLFGHVRGAFSGAERAKAGAATRAHGGTLFLDEIGDASAGAQAKLLRFCETGTYRPVGDVDERRSDARLVSATHRPLEEWAQSGAFRRDLLHRLRVVEVRMPPLRERPEDLPILLRAMLAKAAARVGREPPPIDDILPPLRSHRWPGNVRELGAVAERMVLLERAPEPSDVAALLRGAPEPDTRALDSHVREAERRAIEEAIAAAGGNKTEAARRLGISRRSLYNKLAAFEDE